MVGLISIGLFKTVGKLFLKLFDLICKIKPLRKFQSQHDRVERYIINMQTAFRDIARNYKIMILVVISKIIAFGIYYSIPFFALRSAGVHVSYSEIPYIMALTAFTLTIATWVPTPGGAGGVEVAFALLYSPYIMSYGYDGDTAKSISIAIMLIWRFLTYYLLIGYGFVLYLLFERRDKSNSNKNELEENLEEEASNTEEILEG